VSDRRRNGTRDRLIRAATGLFRRRGVAGVGVGEICAGAQVTKGVFSHHFPGGKDELVVAVVDRNGADVSGQLAAFGSGDAADSVQALFRAYASAMRLKGSDFGCPVAAAVVDGAASTSPAISAANVAFDRWRVILGERLGGDDMGALVVAALEGAILLARAEKDPATLERVGDALAQLIEPATRSAG
jgi:TetR/AcrR family transcriptional repressor of lmrAB and yxaGH operons